jgi:ATP-dependent helicase/nuclease subunit B
MARLYSDVLGRVIGQMIHARRPWTGPSASARPMIRTHAAAVGATLRDQIMISSGRNRHMLERAQNELELTVATQEAIAARGDFVPSMVSVKFGNADGDGLPALSVESPQGHTIHVSGAIDRIDFAEQHDGSLAASAINYRLTENKLALDRVYHGLSLQLLTYLLVLQVNGESLIGKPLTPAAAFYVKTLRGLESIDHPDDATPPDSPQFLLKDKARGVIDVGFAQTFDHEFKKKSDVVMVEVTAEGKPSDRSNDSVSSNDFAALLQLVRVRISELVDRLIAGDIEVKPFRIGNESPCAHCNFRSVCRFDPTVDRYRYFDRMSRSQVLEQLR